MQQSHTRWHSSGENKINLFKWQICLGRRRCFDRSWMTTAKLFNNGRTEGKKGGSLRTQRWPHTVGGKQCEQSCKYADAELMKSLNSRERAHTLLHARWQRGNKMNECEHEQRKEVENRRGHPIKEEEDDWWRHEKKKWLCAYRAQMSRGNCVGGLLCRYLPACLQDYIVFFPAVLILRFSWRAQHNPDRHITKGTTGVILYFRFPFV